MARRTPNTQCPPSEGTHQTANVLGAARRAQEGGEGLAAYVIKHDARRRKQNHKSVRQRGVGERQGHKCWTDVGDVGDEDEEWGCLTSHASRRAKNQHGAIG